MLIQCRGYAEYAARIGGPAHRRAREPGAQGQEARRGAQRDPDITTGFPLRSTSTVVAAWIINCS